MDVTIGAQYRHTSEHGLGHRARIADPDVDENAKPPKVNPADPFALRRDLDMDPGTIVTVAGVDTKRGLILVEWSDRLGTPRITSLEPDDLAANYERVEE